MIQKLKACFDTAPVNLGRQQELDIAKGIAIIFMVLSHVFEILCWFVDPEISLETTHGIYESFLGGSFAAPVFLFCMGISFAYSGKDSPAQLFRRGLVTLGLAFLLELLRTAIPGFLEWLIFRDPEAVEYVYYFFCVDILHFVAVALMVLALFRKLKLKPVHMILIALVCSLAGQLLQWVSTGYYWLDAAAGLIWHSYEESYFPLLNWLIIPVCGYAFGPLWQRLGDKQTFFRLTGPVSWVITAAYFLPMLLTGRWYFLSGGDYYGLGLLDAAFALVVCWAVISLGYRLSKGMGKAARWLAGMGARVTSMYVIHWTVYGFLYLLVLCLIGDGYLPRWTMLPVGLAVLILSDRLSALYENRKKARRQKALTQSR